MSKEYGLYYHENQVGFVRLSKCGRFYSLTCRFQLQQQGAFRLFADSGKGRTDLGQCVQYGQALGAERYLPVNVIGEGELNFYILPAGSDGAFIPIDCERPFHQLDKLSNARFAVRSGRKGILLGAQKNQDYSTAM